jgi:hypothetical protein
MNILHTYRQWRHNPHLAKEGENLKKEGTPHDKFVVWLAAVRDYLGSTLPEGSSLRDEFNNILTLPELPTKVASPQAPATLTPAPAPSDGLDEYRKRPQESHDTPAEVQSPETGPAIPTPPSAPSQKEVDDKKIDAVLGVLRYVRLIPLTANPPPKDVASDDAAQVQLEREIDAIISERIVHSWAFRIPALILGFAVIFAVFGIIKIQDYEVKLSDIVQQSIAKAQQDILSRTEDIQLEISRTASGKLKTLQDDIDAATAVQMQGLTDQSIRGQQMISDTTELRTQELISRSVELQGTIKDVASSQIGVIKQQVADAQNVISNTLQVADLPGRTSNLEQRLEEPLRFTPNFAVNTLIIALIISSVLLLIGMVVTYTLVKRP